MELAQKTVVVTGGASGIGAALAQHFAAAGARVVVADRNGDAANQVAIGIGGLAHICDVTNESEIQNLVHITEAHYGPIDVFCSNAGAFWGEPEHAASASNDVWQKNWELHVMSHVYAARAVLPGMIERRSGHLLQMASAAGVLSQIGDAAYSATKAAAVSFAQSLAITHGKQGIKVSVICPQYVATPMLGYSDSQGTPDGRRVMSPDDVAKMVLQDMKKGKFMILPHPEVKLYIQAKAQDQDAWVGSMQKLRGRILKTFGKINLEDMHKM